MANLLTTQRQQRWLQRERRYVTRFYTALLALIIVPAVVEPWVISTLARLFELVCCIVAAWYFVLLWRNSSLVVYRGWIGWLVVALLLCLGQIALRGIFTHTGLKDFFLFFLSKRYFLPFVIPMLLLFVPNRRHMGRIGGLFYRAALWSFPLWLLNITHLVGKGFEGEHIGEYLPYLACFLLAFPFRIRPERKRVLWVVWAIYLLLMILNARRNIILTLVAFGAWSFFGNYRHTRRAKVRRLLTGLAVLLVVSVPLLMYGDSIFASLLSRYNEDTRSDVETSFWLDFVQSPLAEQLLGRGGSGSYAFEAMDMETGEMITERFVVETGYLNMLLKGGYLFFTLIVTLMLTCLVKAGRSRGPVARSLTFLFLLFIVDSYTTDVVCFYGTLSMLFWICLNLCVSSGSPSRPVAARAATEPNATSKVG